MSEPVMSSRAAESRLEVLQIYRLMQYIHEKDKVQIAKMVNLGVENLICLTEPRDGSGVLHVAASVSNLEMVTFLLSLGAHTDIQDKMGLTAAMVAAELGSHAILEVLAQNKADLQLKDTEGKGVLFYCMHPTKRHLRCLQVALMNQADVNDVSAQGTHVFQLMCEKAKECTPMCLVMLEEGADPNATDKKTGVTALMEAAKAGSLQLVRSILKGGGNPNALDKKRSTAVHYAAMGGFFEVMQVLSAYSADMGVIDRDECTPLHYAAVTGDANCCKFLAQRGCNPSLKNREGLLPRQIAKDAGYKAAAKELRKAEKEQKKGNKSGGGTLMSDCWALTLHDWSQVYETELRQAFGEIKSETVTSDMFISVLDELNAPVELDHLHTVISAHDKGGEGCVNVNDFIKGVQYIKKPFLLSSYMPKKKKDKKGKEGKKKAKLVIPLPICTLPLDKMPRRPDGTPQFMIEKYYNLSDIRRFDHPPEHPIMNDSDWYMEKPDTVYVSINYCVRSGDLESVNLALSQGVPVDVQDHFYKTPLMTACSSGNYEIAQYLLSKGADVNKCDQFFWTPLHHAAHAGQVSLVELLLEAGATVDAPAIGGGTPLMRAIESSRPSCVDCLIKAGASVKAKTKTGRNCLDIARAFADSRVVEIVKDKMDSLPKENVKTRKGQEGKAQKPKPAKEKAFTVDGAMDAEMSTTTAGKASLTKDSTSVILQNTYITTGMTNAVDISFVPKTVWGKPPTTSQLMSKIERRKEVVSIEMDFDFMMPFSQNIQRKTLELSKTTD